MRTSLALPRGRPRPLTFAHLRSGELEVDPGGRMPDAGSPLSRGHSLHQFALAPQTRLAANRVGDQTLHRQCAACEDAESRTVTTSSVPAVDGMLAASIGRQLGPAALASMGYRFGHDFSGIRVQDFGAVASAGAVSSATFAALGAEASTSERS